MAWQLRHEGSPRVIPDLTLQEIADGLRDGAWEATDEVRGPDDAGWRRIESHPRLAELAEELAVPPRPREQEATSLDMNALIDVCLVLLIFFILTTSYANLVQKVVPLPTSRAEGTKARVVKPEDVKSRMIRLQVAPDKAGNPAVRVENQTVDVATADGKGIDTAKLTAALRPYARGEDRKTEILLDARDVTWETVIQIQDAARSADIDTIHHLSRK
jgi:biopolymer transport protein ExbD